MSQDRVKKWLGNEFQTFEGLERRHWVRVACEWKILCKEGESSYNGSVVDVSARGLQIRVSGAESLRRGDEIVLESRQPVAETNQAPCSCRIRWARKDGPNWLLGVAFVDPDGLEGSWVHPLLVKVFRRRVEQRRFTLRIHCNLTGHIHTPQGLVPVTIRDLSVGGALVEGAHPFDSGTKVQLTFGPWAPLPAVTVSGIIQRSGKPGAIYSFGIRFDGSGNRELLLSYVRSAYQNVKR